jgi:hypothetical protein
MSKIKDCTCKVGPGKFEGESALTFLAWQQVLIGGSDETVGAYDFFKAPYNLEAGASVKAALDYGYCEACVKGYDDGSYGLGVRESAQGFVNLITYATERRYLQAIEWAEAKEEEVGDYEDADEDEEA